MDSELEAFKRDIDLRAYAAEQGYAPERSILKEKCTSVAMEKKGIDKIVVGLDDDGHYVYFSVRDDTDKGSIIDFIKRRKRLNLGQMRKELRPWIGRVADPLLFPKLERTKKDRLAVETSYQRMNVATRHPYLEGRGITAAILASDRFAGRIRIDSRGNAIFPHDDQQGLCGYEKKNRNFTGFSTGGEKGLWISHVRDDDAALVFGESGIDVLSHAILFPDPKARYASIGGQVSPNQPVLIKAAIMSLPAGAQVIAGMDADDAGRKLSAMIARVVEETARQDLVFREHLPDVPGADWNDILRLPARQQRFSFPTAWPVDAAG